MAWDRFSAPFAVLGAKVDAWLALEQEAPHRLCWFTVCFGLGVILFFQSDGTATAVWPLLGAMLCLAVARYSRGSPWAMWTALALFAILAGFLSGVLRLYRVEAPVLHETTVGTISGYIETVDYRAGRSPQLVIALRSLAEIAPSGMPKRVRVTLRYGTPPPAGKLISAKVRLLPLPQPVRPSGYDFARDSYFKGLGALGSVSGKMTVVETGEAPPLEIVVSSAIDRARNELTRRISDAVGGEAGGVAAALVTGKRGYIPEETNDVLRAAGIYHIVSISGLHMVMAAGIVFFITRAILALFPVITLCWPIKKISAIIAMAGAIAYCLFSGAEVATQRSLIMTLIMLGAILIERRALSMRNLAIAALLIMVTMPEAVLSPGFQMSFGAVAALISLANASEYFTLRVEGGRLSRMVRRCANATVLSVATTLIAGFATAPFAAYHFQTAVPFGLIGNALALPLVSLVVMPLGALGALAYLFSLDQPIWQIMGMATAAVLHVSRWVASLDGSLLHFPAFDSGAVLMAALALILATVMVSPLRYASSVPLAIALVWAGAPDRNLVFVDRDGRGAAVRGADGKLFIVGSANTFLAEQWLRADGDARRGDDESLRRENRCDGSGCIGEGVVTVAVVKKTAAFREDCKRADVVISRFSAPLFCAAPVVIDRNALERNGAAVIRFSEDKWLDVIHVRAKSSAWPWSPRSRGNSGE